MGDPAGSMKKSLFKRVISLFVVINIPGNCEGILIDLWRVCEKKRYLGDYILIVHNHDGILVILVGKLLGKICDSQLNGYGGKSWSKK